MGALREEACKDPAGDSRCKGPGAEDKDTRPGQRE